MPRPIMALVPFPSQPISPREIVELGDGQVAGLPSPERAGTFFHDIAKRLG